jgi:hypothetical protein
MPRESQRKRKMEIRKTKLETQNWKIDMEGLSTEATENTEGRNH